LVKHRFCGRGGRCRVVSDEQAVDIVDWANGSEDSSLAEADRFVAEVGDFNAEALPPGVGEDKSLEDISAQDTRIHPEYGLRLEARNVHNSEGKE